MRSRNLVILAVLVVVVGVFIFFVERHQPSTDERLERADRVFGELDEAAVVSLELTTGAGPIRLARTGDDWHLVEPVEYPADAAAVRSLMQSIASLDAERVLSLDEVDAVDYGLDAPNLGVVMVLEDGTRFSLSVGDETPLGSKRAVRRDDDDEILLCSGAIASSIDKEVDQWRSRDVVDLLEHDLITIEIETADDRIRATRADDRWQLDQPVADLADAEQMRSLVSELNGLRISEFLPADQSFEELGLGKPEYRVVLTRADGGDGVTLELAPPDEGKTTVVCRRNGDELFLIPDGIRARLGKAPVLWRSGKVWPFQSWDAGRVEIASGDDEILLDRVDGLWRLEDGGDTDGAEVRRRLNALADLEVREHDLMLPPTDVIGSVILILDDDEGAEGLTYTFYAPIEEGGHAAVTVSTRKNVMGVDAAVAETIVGEPGKLGPEAGGDLVGDEAPPAAE